MAASFTTALSSTGDQKSGNLLGPGSRLGKASIGDRLEATNLFGNIGSPDINTPAFSFSEGTLSRGSGFLDSSGRILSDLEGNRGRFSTGFTEFTASRLQDIENARARTVGNLRSQLGRRGILGASFAQDAVTRTEIDFAQQADRVRAEAQVAEAQLDLQNLQAQQATNQTIVANQLAELGFARDFVLGINQAIIQRDQIAAQLAIANLQKSSSGNSVRSSSQGITALSRFTIGGKQSTAFQGSTGTTATSTPIIGFDNSFNIASTINPNEPKRTGTFS